METKFKIAVEKYQCPGCVSGCDISCFETNETGGIGCGKHHAGTLVLPGVGNIFLGIPKGFNRLGEYKSMKPNIYETFEGSEWTYDKWNVPIWKYLSADKHTFVRGICPRVNRPFLHIFLEDCIEKIDCLRIYQDDVDGMD